MDILFYGMKKVFRLFIVALFLLFFWPFFLYKKYGNTQYRLQKKTIIVCNHYSTFDAFYIYLRFGIFRKINFVTISKTRKKPLTHFITWLFDCLYIEDDPVNFAFFKRCLAVLNADGVICIFPEGEINPLKSGFMDFKNSFAWFAKKTGATVLPLYVYPELRAFRRAKLYIGEEILPGFCLDKSVEEISVLTLSRIMEYSLNFN